MSKGHEENEFIAVRVQDPRVQNEGSWNSYVDYKIFLHTNSKAFTAKTSCVRRRYSEFLWLKKKLQKNCGLVPVPDLPGRSFFYFSNEDFLERRRTGLQIFLDNVLHMTVCLSDSQLHLFLQTQLPVGHIQDCVQGHTPYTVTDAILTYASSNVGWAQAQEEDLSQEPSLTPVPYESMESPAPHLPIVPNKEASNSAVPSSNNAEPLESIVEVHDTNTEEVEFSSTEHPSLKVLQRDNHLEAVLERHSPAEATFFLGDGQDEPASDRSSLEEEIHPGCYQILTPVQVHTPTGTGIEDECDALHEKLTDQNGASREERCTLLDTAIEIHRVPSNRNITHLDIEKEDGQGHNIGKVAMVNASDELETQEQVPEHITLMEHITECVNISEEGVLGRPISEKALEKDDSLGGNGVEGFSSADNVVEHASSDEPLLEHHAVSEMVQECVTLEKEVLKQVTANEQILECNGIHVEHILESVSSEELGQECHAISEEAVHHINLEEVVPEPVGCEEQVIEHVNSHGQQLLECDGSEELVLEHHAISEEVVDHVSLAEEIPERVSSEQKVSEHVNHCEEQLLEDVGSEELVSECFAISEEVEKVVSPEKEVAGEVDSEEKILEYAGGNEEPLSECRGSEEPLLEQHATSEEVVDDINLEGDVPEQIGSDEHNLELVNGHEVQNLEYVSSEEKVLQQHVSSAEEVVEQHVSSAEEVVEQHVSSEEKVIKQHVSSVEEVLEQHVSSVEEVLEQHVSSVEEVLEQQVSSVEEVLEQHVSSTEEILEQHVSSEHEVLEQHASSVEEVIKQHVSSTEEILEHVSSEHEVLEQHVSTQQEVVEQCISLEEKVVEKHDSSEEKVVEQHVSAEEKVLEQHITSKEEVLEHHISAEEKVLEQNDCCELEVLEQHVRSEEKVLEQHYCSEENVLEQHNISEEAVVEHVGLGQVFDSFSNEKFLKNVSSSEEHVQGETQGLGVEKDPHNKHRDNIEHADMMDLNTDQEEQNTVVTAVGVDQGVHVIETSDKEGSDGNESAADKEEAMNRYMEITCKGKNHNTDILNPKMGKYPTQVDSSSEANDTMEERGRIEPQEKVEIPYMTNNSSSANTLGFSGSVSGRDMTASRGLVVEESNYVGNLAGGHTSEQATLSLLSIEASEQNCEKDVQGFTAEVVQTDLHGMAAP